MQSNHPKKNAPASSIMVLTVVAGLVCIAAPVEARTFSNKQAIENAHFPHSLEYLSGGVGDDERLWIDRVSSRYDFKAVFSGNRGIYVSSVDVMIHDTYGNLIVNTITDGPVLLADLNPGTYTMRATAGDVTRKSRFYVNGNTIKTVNVQFPIDENAYTTGEYVTPTYRQPVNYTVNPVSANCDGNYRCVDENGRVYYRQ